MEGTLTKYWCLIDVCNILTYPLNNIQRGECCWPLCIIWRLVMAENDPNVMAHAQQKINRKHDDRPSEFAIQ